MIHVVSVRVGDKYGPEYVLNLHDGICRHLGEEQTHWCVTDDPESLPEGVNRIPHNPNLPGWWQKVALFDDARMPWHEGDEILYMDLDVCVTGRLEGLAHGIIKDWHWPTYNSSVMRWRHGDHADIWNRFRPDIIDRETVLFSMGLLPKGQKNGGDQEWISNVSSWHIFDVEDFVSYRDAVAWPREGSRAIVFHGEPKPHEVTEGWVPLVWKAGGMTAPPVLDGMNVSADFAYDNVAINVQRELEWFSGFGSREGTCVIVGGGPSLGDGVQAIKNHRRRDATIVTVNNALSYLCDRGITPDAHVMLDARQENAEMVRKAPDKVRYFLASQVHPSVYEAISEKEVVVWHNGMHDGSRMMELVKPWFDEGPNQKPVIFVPGGGTVGLRALNLAWLSGYKKIHLYGFDSSYEDGSHHAYPQSLNDGDNVISVRMGEKTYQCAPWMLRQAKEFQENYAALRDEGVKVFVHGRGLIPDIWRSMQ